MSRSGIHSVSSFTGNPVLTLASILLKLDGVGGGGYCVPPAEGSNMGLSKEFEASMLPYPIIIKSNISKDILKDSIY